MPAARRTAARSVLTLLTALIGARSLGGCKSDDAHSAQPAPQSPSVNAASRTDGGAARADAAPARPATPLDPGQFQRFGCQTDAMPPHIVAGRATVTWRPAGGGAFSYVNLPARCGGAFPGQIVGSARTRPGDGAEFVVCMPEERRLDIGILRRGAVPVGAQDIAHTANLVRLRLGLDRYVNVVSSAGTADPAARLAFGPRMRAARGSARLGATPEGPAAGTVEFEIDCTSAR